MEPQITVSPSAPAPAAAEPSMSPFQRMIAIYTRPGSAWGGLTTKSQWWFPVLVMLLFGVVFSLLLYHRAIFPMIQQSWDDAVASGRMTNEQVDQASAFMGGPMGIGITIGQQVIGLPLILLATALVLWFGVGFVLGTKFKFRLAFEAVCWSSLITLPGQILTGVIAWSHETMKGVHVGLGILLPESDPPTKLQTGLAFFLDAIGPLAIWYVVVLILGAAALSGAPRKRVAWVVGGLYLVFMVFFSILGAMFARGGS